MQTKSTSYGKKLLALMLSLLMLVSVGAATYGAMLLVVARPLVRETVALVRNRV